MMHGECCLSPTSDLSTFFRVLPKEEGVNGCQCAIGRREDRGRSDVGRGVCVSPGRAEAGGCVCCLSRISASPPRPPSTLWNSTNFMQPHRKNTKEMHSLVINTYGEIRRAGRGGRLRRAASCGSVGGDGWRGGLTGKAERGKAGRVRQTDSCVYYIIKNNGTCF